MENILPKALQLVTEAQKKGVQGLNYSINFNCSIIDIYAMDEKFNVKWKISAYFSNLLSDFSSEDTHTVTAKDFIPELEKKLKL